MRNSLVFAIAALLLLEPAVAGAQGRGREMRAAAREDRGRADRREERREELREERRGESRRLQRPPPMRQERSFGPGQVLPPAFRRGQLQDFTRHRLRPPPPGYDWVRVGPDIYLMQRSTGLVLETIPGGF
jgi:Ni/Co efflux regulator RcnB